MNKEQLIELVVKAQQGDIESRNSILEFFYPSVCSSAQKTWRAIKDDLVWEAMLNLLTSIKKFDSNKSDDFRWYAWYNIKKHWYSFTWKHIRSWLWSASNVFSDMWVVALARQKYFNAFWAEPSNTELQAMLWWWDSKSLTIFALTADKPSSVSLNDIVLLGKNTNCFVEFDKDIVNNQFIVKKIKKCLSYLSKKDREIFRDRYLRGMKLKKMSKKYWITIEGVRLKTLKILSMIKSCYDKLWN